MPILLILLFLQLASIIVLIESRLAKRFQVRSGFDGRRLKLDMDDDDEDRPWYIRVEEREPPHQDEEEATTQQSQFTAQPPSPAGSRPSTPAELNQRTSISSSISVQDLRQQLSSKRRLFAGSTQSLSNDEAAAAALTPPSTFRRKPVHGTSSRRLNSPRESFRDRSLSLPLPLPQLLVSNHEESVQVAREAARVKKGGTSLSVRERGIPFAVINVPPLDEQDEEEGNVFDEVKGTHQQLWYVLEVKVIYYATHFNFFFCQIFTNMICTFPTNFTSVFLICFGVII